MIGITFALPSESSDLIRRLQSQRQHDNLILGTIDNRKVAIVHTGVGGQHCSQRLEILIHKARPKFVISAGFAGAVSDALNFGDLILAENFSDSELLDTAERILSKRQPQRVKLFTSTSIVDSISERNEIARASRASAVDMETGAIVAVCRSHGVPLLSFRAISDTPREAFPAPPAVLFDVEFQRTSYGRLASYLLRHPGSIPRLVSFSRHIAYARARLTDGVVDLLPALGQEI
jgi:adenosylhomocysteine nucleosidase